MIIKDIVEEKNIRKKRGLNCIPSNTHSKTRYDKTFES